MARLTVNRCYHPTMPTQPSPAAPGQDQVPTTVGAYVRAKLPSYVKKFFFYGLFLVPISAAMHVRNDGWDLTRTIGAAAMAVVVIPIFFGAIAAVALTVGGWWETRRYRA